ncbi:MAG TPA: M23 family metallopeptidase [Bacteroidota bacterium]|nr:M23 family metallopeptidase [Bacteroidota bacterium]
MPPESIRRKKKPPRLFDIVVVPVGEGEKTKTLRASRKTLVLLVVAGFLLAVLASLAVLVFTPIAMYLPIPNPVLEARYGRELADLQRRLDSLAGDFEVVRAYNTQVRKALGEGSTGDTTTSHTSSISMSLETAPPQAQTQAEVQAPPTAEPASSRQEAPSLDESSEGLDLSTENVYTNVVTSTDAGRSTFPLLTPVEGIISQGFDPAASHYGVDFAGKRGTPVFAAADGHVVFAGWTYDDGNMVILAHDGGYMTVYKHNQTLLTTLQSFVRRGEPIALLGASGRTSAGPHLHFEVWKNGTPRDPDEYLLVQDKAQ